jgi:hypothetical protein
MVAPVETTEALLLADDGFMAALAEAAGTAEMEELR